MTYTHENLPLVGKHVPDVTVETLADGTKHTVSLPGKYVIGTEIEGVFVPLEERKAAGLFGAPPRRDVVELKLHAS